MRTITRIVCPKTLAPHQSIDVVGRLATMRTLLGDDGVDSIIGMYSYRARMIADAQNAAKAAQQDHE